MSVAVERDRAEVVSEKARMRAAAPPPAKGPRLAPTGPLSMGSARYLCTAVPVDAQHILVIGGHFSGGDTAATIFATTEILDVAANEFAPGPAMRGRCSCTAARLDAADGQLRFLVLGGGPGRTAMSTTESLAMSRIKETRERRGGGSESTM
mmetsp:Transcript_17086/g.60775  ORF Transcript_17086/g.60775 Transcript_17086/m.60775 type:complete len:152 (+) Transcript_17086:42-497(+)